MEDVRESSGKVAPRFRLTYWDFCTGFFPLLTLLPLLIGHVSELVQSPSTTLAPFGWLMLAGVILWKGRGDVCVHETRITLAVFFFFVAMIIHALAVIHWSFSLTHWAAVTYLVGWGLGRFRETSWSQVVGWGGALALMNTIPLIETQLDGWLTETSGLLASWTLDHYRIPHLWEHGKFLLRDGEFAGLSVISPRLGLAVGIWCVSLWCCAWSRSFLHAILVLAAVPLVVWMSRYAATLLIAYRLDQYQEDWAIGTMHYWITFGAFAVGIFVLLSWDQFLKAMFKPIPVTDITAMPIFAAANEIFAWPHDTSGTPVLSGDPLEVDDYQHVNVLVNPQVPSWSSLNWRTHRILKPAVYFSMGLMFVWFTIGSLAVKRSGLAPSQTREPNLLLTSLKDTIRSECLPQEFGEFAKTAFVFADQTIDTSNDAQNEPARQFAVSVGGAVPTDDQADTDRIAKDVSAGDVSEKNLASESTTGPLLAQWTYRWQDQTVSFQLTAPHFEWMPPFDMGSKTASKKILQELIEPEKNGKGWNWYRCRILGIYGEFSYLFQCGLSDDLSPSRQGGREENRAWQISRKLKLKGSVDSTAYVYSLSLICESGVVLSDKQLEELGDFFDLVRKSVQKSLKPGLLAEAAQAN